MYIYAHIYLYLIISHLYMINLTGEIKMKERIKVNMVIAKKKSFVFSIFFQGSDIQAYNYKPKKRSLTG